MKTKPIGKPKLIVSLDSILDLNETEYILKVDDAYVLLRMPDRETAMLIHSTCQERKDDLGIRNSDTAVIKGKSLRHFIWFQPCPCCMYHTKSVFKQLEAVAKKFNIKNVIVSKAEFVKEYHLPKSNLCILDKDSPYTDATGTYETIEKYFEVLPPMVSFKENHHFELNVYDFGLVCTLSDAYPS